MFRSFLRRTLLFIGWLISKLLFKLVINGRYNLPASGPFIIIANHFSWFEAPLIAIHLPYKPIYMAATELQDNPFLKLLFYAFEVIPVWRGQVDRNALKQALGVLEQGGVLGIMPEGGIDPDLQERIQKGEKAAHVGQNFDRSQLMPSRPGAAYLATKSQAAILPLAFIGTENTLRNLRRFKRTPVELRIGELFWLKTAESPTNRRQYLQTMGDEMMHHIAALLPPENRGPYLLP